MTTVAMSVLVVAAACASEPEGPSSSGSGVEATLTPDQEATVEAPQTAVARSTPTAAPDSTPGGSSETPTQPAPTAEPLRKLDLERVFSWYAPDLPTHLEQSPDGRILVAEQDGRLVEIIGGPDDATGSTRVVLDISERVLRRIQEEGLLGFAFHPNFEQNSKIFIYYSTANPRRSVISEFTFASDGSVDEGSERIVIEVGQPYGNHNGGMLAFDQDGYLYIALGDGGGAGDTRGNGQNLSTLLGSILRIDVDAEDVPYAVPQDNPFVGELAANGEAARGEIWAYGLRNPWRMAFDRETGELWAADVGQNDIEEVDLIVKGGNYGWNIREGDICYQPSSGCEEVAPDDLISPVASYTHRVGCSITGGYVYDGSRFPSLRGAYIFGDFCAGKIWALQRDGAEFAEPFELYSGTHVLPAFGQTLDGEVYVLTYSPGIFRFAGE